MHTEIVYWFKNLQKWLPNQFFGIFEWGCTPLTYNFHCNGPIAAVMQFYERSAQALLRHRNWEYKCQITYYLPPNMHTTSHIWPATHVIGWRAVAVSVDVGSSSAGGAKNCQYSGMVLLESEIFQSITWFKVTLSGEPATLTLHSISLVTPALDGGMESLAVK